ncbi:methylamine utilization protein [Vreelandella aquamarina]
MSSSRFFVPSSRYLKWLPGCVAMLFGIDTLAAEVSVADLSGTPLKNAVVEVFINNAGVSATQTASIIQRDATFHPQVITIPTGSQVTFPNKDTTRHHVFSFSPAKTFDLKLYLSETPEPVRFDTPGVVVLGCNIHDHMQAFIVVSEAPYAALTDEQGQLQISGLPEGQHRMRVWHSRMDDSHSVWWEGEISDSDSINVRVALNALPSEPPVLSPLQQRFQEATTRTD